VQLIWAATENYALQHNMHFSESVLEIQAYFPPFFLMTVSQDNPRGTPTKPIAHAGRALCCISCAQIDVVRMAESCIVRT
jgi:hypothetical protein